MLGRLTELMFVEILREDTHLLPDRSRRRPQPLTILTSARRYGYCTDSRSLWTVDELAREIGSVSLGAGAALHGPGR